MAETDRDPLAPMRKRVYEVLDVGRSEDGVALWIDRFLVVLILLNVLAFAAETVPSLAAEYGAAFYAFNIASVAIFTIEYVLRIWSAIEIPFLKSLSPGAARFRYALRPYPLIDLLAILPFYLSFFVAIDLRVVRVLRLFRLLKLARYSPALQALIQVIVNERRALIGAVVLMLIMLLFSATGIYYLERHVQPEAFGTIPDAGWWAMATLTTVGYGDVTPVTALGKLFGSVVMLLGLGMFALPIAIISTGFSQEVSRRDFVVTWPLAARIPLLADLDPKSIADLLPHLKAHRYPAGWDVISAGDDGNSMFLIASGKVRARAPNGDLILKTGDFFGEIALLSSGTHQVTHTTLGPVRALELDREDFRRLENLNPGAVEHIRRTAMERVADRETP